MTATTPSLGAAMPRAGSLTPGFADPVHDGQAVFRAVLDAMSTPGRIVELLSCPDPAPPGLGAAAGAVALALADFETPVFLASTCGAAGAWLRFHCGTPLVGTGAEASFAFATAASCPPLDTLDLGSEEYPDRSTTLVVEVASLAVGPGLRLSGPGIQNVTTLEIGGIAEPFWRQRAALRRHFPRGLDLIFTAGRHLAALPRTTQVEA